MSDSITRETLRIGTGSLFACYGCGIPKREDEFEGESILCRLCATRELTAQHTQVTEEDIRKTKYDLALQRLRESQEPVVPEGVRKAHIILGGISTPEILAELIRDMRDGQKPDGSPVWIARDPKIFVRSLELLLRAEFKHDDSLKTDESAAPLSYEEVRSLSIDTIVQEMVRDRSLRIKVLGILYERCPGLIDELMQVASITVVDASNSEALDLEEVI